MTPLEAQRMRHKDHVYEVQIKTTGFRREVSQHDVQAAAASRLVDGVHVADAMRRESSFHKQRAETISKLLSM